VYEPRSHGVEVQGAAYAPLSPVPLQVVHHVEFFGNPATKSNGVDACASTPLWCFSQRGPIYWTVMTPFMFMAACGVQM
jgi:hypothetical protein